MIEVSSAIRTINFNAINTLKSDFFDLIRYPVFTNDCISGSDIHNYSFIQI